MHEHRLPLCIALALALSAAAPLNAQLASRTTRSQPAPRPEGATPTDLAAPALRGATLNAHRISGDAPVVDGRLEDAAWLAVPVSSDFTQREPAAGSAASERTEVRVLFDEDNLYIGARMLDSRADSIVSILSRRDVTTPADQFVVALDTYRDRRTAFVFRLEPGGTRSDWMVVNGREQDYGWDAVWQGATRTDSAGWTAELMIPLTQLRFASTGEAATESWGINFFRSIARRGEWDHWSLIPPDASEDVAHYGELAGAPVPRSLRRLEILPYLLAEGTRGGDRAWAGAVGADVKLGVGRNLTLSATLNPDFGQVEADPSQLDLSGHEAFLEERRPFFVEGADLFQGWYPQLFYSRRIGRAPQGSAPDDAEEVVAPRSTRILGAAKLTGKTAGGWSLALLSALTGAATAEYTRADGSTGRAELEPATSYAIARLGRELRQGRTRVGFTFTAVNRDVSSPELRFLPRGAYAAGIDLLHRLGTGGEYYLRGTLQGSSLSGDTAAIARVQRSFLHYYQRPDATHLAFDPAATTLKGYNMALRFARESGGSWRWGVFGAQRSPGFEINDLGFLFDADVRFANAWVGYENFRSGTLLRRRALWVNSFNQWDFGNRLLRSGLFARGDLQLANYWEASFALERGLGGYDTKLLRGGPAVRRSNHTWGNLRLATDGRSPLSVQLGVSGSVHDQDGGSSAAISPGLVLRPGARAELSLAPSYSRSRTAAQVTGAPELDGQRHWVVGELVQTTASLTARASYTFTPSLSFQFYAQPFLSAARYARLAELADPYARDAADRFRRYGDGAVARADGERRIDRDGDGDADFAIGEPDFTVRELNANAVLRWEYRRGSTLFLVWSHGRSGTGENGTLDLARDASRLFRLPSRNTLALKLSHWLN